MSTDLFAGLARKALQTTAIKPRLPSRFESLVSGPVDGAAGAPGIDTAFMPPPSMPSPVRSTARDGRVASQAEALLHAPASLTASSRTAQGLAREAPQAPPLRSTAARSAPPAHRDERPAAAQPAHAPSNAPADSAADSAAPVLAAATAERLAQADALPPQTRPAKPTAPSPGWLTQSPPAQVSPSAPAAADGALALRERIAQQVARLLDEHAALPSRVTSRVTSQVMSSAGAGAPAVSTSPLRGGRAAPHVDITIGSIDIVLTPAPVAAPARTAPPPPGPAVQSLDAYLQARQRRGGGA